MARLPDRKPDWRQDFDVTDVIDVSVLVGFSVALVWVLFVLWRG